MALNAPRTITITVISETDDFPSGTELMVHLEDNKKYLAKDVVNTLKAAHPDTIDTIYLMSITGHLLTDFTNVKQYDSLKAIIM